MLKRVTALSLAAILSVSLFTACGTTSGSGTESTSAQDGGLTGEITFSLNRSEEELATLYQPIADRFMEENPGTSITFVVHETDAQVEIGRAHV